MASCVLCAVCCVRRNPHRLGVTTVLLPVHHTWGNDDEASRYASRAWSQPVADPPTADAAEHVQGRFGLHQRAGFQHP